MWRGRNLQPISLASRSLDSTLSTGGKPSSPTTNLPDLDLSATLGIHARRHSLAILAARYRNVDGLEQLDDSVHIAICSQLRMFDSGMTEDGDGDGKGEMGVGFVDGALLPS